MFSLERDKDSICAISTPVGTGAIAVVRLSGNDAVQIVQKLASFLPQELESHRVYYGVLVDPENQERIDEVLLTYFASGRSFTGEYTIEISCHGSPVMTQKILTLLMASGARLAQKGEFTYRAFMNGRIDLVQAESILALIESQTPLQSRMALRQLEGDFSKRVHVIEEDLTWCLSRLEANIDFASEDIEIASTVEIKERAQKAQFEITSLLTTYQAGKTIREGLRIVLVGAPNVGKSSLLNALSSQNRAIVSQYAGTTRDTLETEIYLKGQKLTVVDTAGLRQTQDELENLGIERTREACRNADVICYVYDALENNSALPSELTSLSVPIVVLVNKCDLLPEQDLNPDVIFVSAKTGAGLERLKDKLSTFLTDIHEENSPVILQARHYELLAAMNVSLCQAIELLSQQASPEFIISDMKVVLNKCFEILGKTFDDEVLDRVFQDFCLGK